jgi:hypothetical protein
VTSWSLVFGRGRLCHLVCPHDKATGRRPGIQGRRLHVAETGARAAAAPSRQLDDGADYAARLLCIRHVESALAKAVDDVRFIPHLAQVGCG